jgi:hypothetical protein
MTNFSGTSDEVTHLLFEWSKGNQAALDKLMPMVYKGACAGWLINTSTKSEKAAQCRHLI